MQATFKEFAIVLRTTPLREADMIASLLCERRGRISAHVRGAKKSKKRFMGGIDLFDCGLFELRSPRGNSELYQLTGISNRTPFPALRSNLTKFSCSAFCLEVTSLFTHESDPESSFLFNPLKDCLTELDLSEEALQDPLVLTIQFTLKALALSGFDARERFSSSAQEITPWWDLLVSAKQDAPIPSEDFVVKSIHTLTTFIEEIQDKQLRTKEGLLHCLRSYTEL